MNNIIKKFKKASINAKSDFDFYQLERKSHFLLNCHISKTIDEVVFEFETLYEKPYEQIKKVALISKYQALINIQNLFNDIKRIYISLNPENLMFDTNMMPKAIMRDIYETEYNEEDFLSQYIALIGYVLQDKYSYDDYYQGGKQLLTKNKITAPYAQVKTLDELVETLNKEYASLQEKLQNSFIEVDKKKYHHLKIGNRIMIVFIILAVAIIGYFGVFRLNEEKTMNTANAQYIKQDYISVLDTLKNMKMSRMDTNTKYIYAISDIRTEALTDEQKSNILSSVTLNADERILEFWVDLAKSQNSDAIDLAKQLGNSEYLAYAYMKEKSRIENDQSLSGEEKETQLKEIENNLKNLDISSDSSNTDSTNNTNE